MAGGQERILRRRIKSVESTKKITRAMELIAADPRGEGAGARRRGPALQRGDHLGDPRPGQGRRGQGPPAAARTTPTPTPRAFIVVTSDRGLCGGYNCTVIRMAEREIKARQAEGAGLLPHRGRQEGASSTSGSAATASTPRFLGVTDQPTYEHAREVGRRRARALRVGRARLGRPRLHALHHSAGTQEAVVRRFLPLEVEDDGAAETGPTGRPRVRAVADGHPRRAPAPLRRVAASSRRCSTRRRPSTPPASGP